MQLVSFREYLAGLNIASDEKRYSMNFYKKLDYLESLKQSAINMMHCHISSGYGNVNSGICFVFGDEEQFGILKSVMKKYLDNIGVNYYDIYVTFIKKTEKDFPNQWNYLMNELNAIKPGIVYVFDTGTQSIDLLEKEFRKYGVAFDRDKYKLVSVQALLEEDVDALWEVFQYLPGYIYYEGEK